MNYPIRMSGKIINQPLRLIPPVPLDHDLCMKGNQFWLNHDDALVQGEWRCRRCGLSIPTESILRSKNNP